MGTIVVQLGTVVVSLGGSLTTGNGGRTAVVLAIAVVTSRIVTGKSGSYGEEDVRRAPGTTAVYGRLLHRSADVRARVFGLLTMLEAAKAMAGRGWKAG